VTKNLTCKDVGFSEKLSLRSYPQPGLFFLIKRGPSFESLLEHYPKFKNELLWVNEDRECYYVSNAGELFKLCFKRVKIPTKKTSKTHFPAGQRGRLATKS
jgi:hypothetical protein